MHERAVAIRRRHAGLLEAMDALYMLLGQLRVVVAGLVVLPRADCPAPIDRNNAITAGFSEEAVGLIEQLPYTKAFPENCWSMEGICGQYHLNPFFLPDSTLANWVRLCRLYEFEGMRHADGANYTTVMAGTIVRLTEVTSTSIAWLYDVEKCQILVLNCEDKKAKFTNNISGQTPSAVIGPVIQKLGSFGYLDVLSLGIDWGGTVFTQTDEDDYDDGDGDDDGKGTDFDIWYATQKRYRRQVLKAMSGLRSLYLDCGWDVNSSTQSQFDHERFIGQRQRYLDEVVLPVVELRHLHQMDRPAFW